jgi:hypothetical protein
MFSSTTSTESETTKEFATYKKSVPQLQHKINQVSRRLKALSHPDRLKIVSLLINAEYTVQSLSKKNWNPSIYSLPTSHSFKR